MRNEPPENRPRIVTKGQYVQAQGKRIGFGSAGCGLWFLTLLCGVVALFSPMPVFLGGWIGAGYGLGFGMLSLALLKWSRASFRHAAEIEAGVPLTRQVAATLAAEESLVRASEVPLQEQQGVLLRAAGEEPVTSAEELVRPVEEMK